MGKRTVEFILGLIGGILGFLAAMAALALGALAGGLGAAIDSEEAMQSGAFVITLGFAAIVFSIIGIIGAALVKSKPKVSGVLMLVSAFGGLFSISMFYSLSFILLLIAGLMAILKKDQ